MDLRANNARLLDYVRNGGTLIVQYNKTEFNQAQYGPYAAEVNSDRVTDENAPVKVIAPADPVFNTPNKITDAAWRSWVQERGLYFLGGEKDSRYRDLVTLTDSFPDNSGENAARWSRRSSARAAGLCRLGLWRQLPAGVKGPIS
jgi:hypothetical protein